MTLLVGALGGNAGASLSRMIADINRNAQGFTVAMVALPSQPDARLRAYKDLAQLEQVANATFVFDNSETLLQMGVDIPAYCKPSACEERVVSCARQFISALKPFGPIALDIEDVRSIFGNAGISRHTWGTARYEHLGEDTIAAVIGYVLKDWSPQPDRGGLIALSAQPGTMTMPSLKNGLQTLRDCVGQSNPSFKLVVVENSSSKPGSIRADAWLGGINNSVWELVN